MPPKANYTALQGSEHTKPAGDKRVGFSKASRQISVTLVLRRAKRVTSVTKRNASDAIAPMTRAQFSKTLGADPKDLAAIKSFARANRLKVVLAHQARRSVELKGTIAAINEAFQLQLVDYQTPRGRSYRTHEGPVHLPKAISNKVVKCVLGLDTRPIPATHYALRRSSMDPPNTRRLTPLDIASIYEFPEGDGAGQTIGIYEMVTSEGPPGYAPGDVAATMKAFGGGLLAPTPVDTTIDGTRNSGKSDPETLLDITIAGALAQKAKIAVYFTGESSANMVHALQRMIHPQSGDPVPTVISISYGWGLDTGLRPNLTANEIQVIDELFQDAASLAITVLVSTGDSGAKLESKTQAQASFPATDPWVTACGGTTLGNRRGLSFDEYVWNDTWNGGSGATGGGISPHFPVPPYQANHGLPANLVTKKPGRGIPDIAGNASPNSGYPQVIVGQGTSSGGGTSAVAPLYAGLIARINGNVGRSVGFLNPTLYTQSGALFRDVVGAPGPTSNSYGGVTGYPAGIGWDACTGFGSLKGTALQSALANASAATGTPPKRAAQARVFASGAFAGVPIADPFARAAQRESPIIVDIGAISWPSGLKPKSSALGSYRAGSSITGPVQVDAPVDALIVLYTDNETRALLDVFTGDNAWTPSRKKTWVGYAHNFAKFQPIIAGIKGNTALKQGLFGYLSAVRIGTKNVVLYKSELHPKQNGTQLPFVPVMQQLIMELSPKLVLSTGTAGAIGSTLNCGDVAITDTARFHCRDHYPNDPQIDSMSQNHVALTNRPSIDPQFVQLAASQFTRLSLPGLSRCYSGLQQVRGYSFVKKNIDAPSIYVTGTSAVPGPEPMAIVSADYLSVDDKSNAEKLQSLGVMNDTDDAFLFYAITKLTSTKPKWLSVRNASEPEIIAPAGTAPTKMVATIKGLAGRIYGIYQYCTTLNSAFACWGLIAGME